MSVESITRKKLGTTYGDIKFVCCLGNVAIFECEENGDDRRISFPLELLDLAVSSAKLDARRKELENRELEMEEQFRQSNEPTETPNF